MFYRTLSNKVACGVRKLHTTRVVRSGHDTRGIYGSNLPFGVKSRIGFVLTLCVYFGSGLAVPFLSTRHMILSKNG